MEILEFGNKEKDKIILIHGFETPYQIWEKYIEHYKNNYHIIVPILQGHNPNMKEDFNSFEESAKDIEDYIISRYGNNVFAIYGMSMGGVLTSQIWQNKKLYIDKVILESSPLISYNRLMTLMMTKQYLMLTHKTQARDKRVVAQAVNSIIPEDKLDVFLEMMDNMSDTTITNYIRQIGSCRLDLIITFPLNIYVFINLVVKYFINNPCAIASPFLKLYSSSDLLILLLIIHYLKNSLLNQ